MVKFQNCQYLAASLSYRHRTVGLGAAGSNEEGFVWAGVSPWRQDGNHDNENCYIIWESGRQGLIPRHLMIDCILHGLDETMRTLELFGYYSHLILRQRDIDGVSRDGIRVAGL